MEWMLLVLVVAFFCSPIVLSIMALRRTSRLSEELDRLRRALAAGVSEPVPRPPAIALEPKTEAPLPAGAPPARAAPPALPTPGPLPPPIPTKTSMEVAIGGKGASFAGIAALVVGVVFFVGYAIQQQLIGPGLRVVLGLLTGGGLVALGRLAEARGRDLRVLARALTGGGAALFYFCVFASYGIYHLIPVALAGAGLLASAAAVLALAAVYNSQAVAVLGVLGAYLTPGLIGGDLDAGLFTLFFVAVVNAPVLALGLKRGWQWLYNLAFVFTVFFMAAWLDREIAPSGSPWPHALAFCLLYFGEFVALGLVKLKGERAAQGRLLDVARLALCSLALLGAVYGTLDEVDLHPWVGAAFLAGALLHLALARAAFQWRPAFRDEILVFLIGALTWSALALPAQLDGVWVSLGWAIEGLILAWFSVRVGSRFLQSLAVGLGSLGLLKSLAYDVTLYDAPPRLFLNGRFAVGLLSGALLSAQAWLHGRAAEAKHDALSNTSRDWIMAGSVVALVAVVFGDAFVTRQAEDPLAALVTTFAMMMAGTMVMLQRRDDKRPVLWGLGAILLLLVPLKMVLFDLWWSWDRCCGLGEAFVNLFFWCNAVMIVVLLDFAQGVRWPTGGPRAQVAPALNVVALLGLMVLVSCEIEHAQTPWKNSLITLWWAAAALALAVAGFIKRRRYLRLLGLAVFAVTVVKVFLVDLHEFSGLQRVAAFMGVGVLLLLLSYLYQRVAPGLQTRDGEGPGGAL